MSSQIITIDNIEPKVITIDNVATEVITVETIETITIEGVGIQGPTGATGSGGTWGTITGTLSDQIDLKNQQDAQDSAIALNTAKVTFPEAPEDGSQYARKDAGWEIVSADVDSVNGQTGIVVLDTDDIDDSTQVNKYTTAGDISKLAGIEAGAQVNTVDSVNAKTGVVVINPDDLDDSATVNKFVTASQITVIDNQSGVNTGDQDLSGIETDISDLETAVILIEGEQITQNLAISLNTDKISFDSASSTRLANTSGTNTGDQDISGIATNAAAITTINDDAIFSDPASPNEIDFGWLGTRTEYDALVSKPITKMFFVSSFGFLNSVVVSGQTPVYITDSEIYTATVDSNAGDLTYLWTATGTTDATINGSATGSTVTIDYTGTPGDPDSFADIKCVVSSVDVGSSVEDTLQVTIEHVAPVAWTQDFSLLDPVTDVVYGIDPAVTTWIDKGTSATNLTQTTVANQADLVAGYDADGPNLVTNGDFATDSDWTKFGTWVISGGQASCSGGFSQMKQDGITGISGNLVELTMDIVSISSGTLKLRNNGSVIEEFSTTGTFKFYFEAQDDDILFEASGSTVSIDNVVITQTVANTTKNELVFDTTDYYDGIETQAGDFTYYFEMDTSLALGIASRYVSSTSSGNSSLIKKASDDFRLISQESNNNDFSGYNETGGLKKYAFVKEGASAKLFVSGVLESTIGTLIGTFSYDRLGRNSSSALSALKAFKVIDRALTDAEAIAETT